VDVAAVDAEDGWTWTLCFQLPCNPTGCIFPLDLSKKVRSTTQDAAATTQTLCCSFLALFSLYRAAVDRDGHKLWEQLDGVLESRPSVTPSPG
jgi:hypothetical protein